MRGGGEMMDRKAGRRLVVLHEVAQGQLSTGAAAALLGVTERHARRLVEAYQRAGADALRHGNTGRQPAHTIAPAVALARTTYQGCNHQHLAELLAEREGLAISRASVRRSLWAAGLPSPREHAAPQQRVWTAPLLGLWRRFRATESLWLGRVAHPAAECVEAGAAVTLSFQELEPGDMALDRAGAPW